MKFPARFQALGLIGLIFSMIMLIFGIGTLTDITHTKEIPFLYDLITGALFGSAGLWLLISSIYWISGSKYSYVFLYTSAAALVLPVISLYLSLQPGGDHTGFWIFTVIYLVYPETMLVTAFVPVTLAWVKQAGSMVRTVFNPVILAAFAILMAAGPVSLNMVNSAGMYVPCVIDSVKASSSTQDTYPYAVADGKPETAWTPWADPRGINEWIDLVPEEPSEISIVEIFPGAENSSDKSIFGKYNRIKSGYLLFPDGAKIQFTLDDRNAAQQVKFTPVKTGSIRVVITGVYNGSAERVLRVSGIKLLKKTNRFR